MSNRSVKETIRTELQKLSFRLDVKEYRTTDGYRHKDDFRIAVTYDGQVFGDLCVVDRNFWKQSRTNKAERLERDEFVTRTMAGICVRRKGKKQ